MPCRAQGWAHGVYAAAKHGGTSLRRAVQLGHVEVHRGLPRIWQKQVMKDTAAVDTVRAGPRTPAFAPSSPARTRAPGSCAPALARDITAPTAQALHRAAKQSTSDPEVEREEKLVKRLNDPRSAPAKTRSEEL